MKKLLPVTLCAAMLLSCFLTSCTDKPDESATTETVTVEGQTNPDTSADEETTADKETTADEETTEIGTEAPPRVEVEEGVTRAISTVYVATDDTPAGAYAASELKEYLGKKGVTFSESADQGYHINLVIDESLPDDGYTIVVNRKNKEGTVISGGNSRGVLYGVYRFLEEQAGIRFYTPDLEVVPAGGLTITTGVTEYTPVFELRQIDWYAVRNNPDWCAKNGINFSHWYGEFSEEIGGSWNYGSFVHTMSGLTGCPSDSQPCLTDPENLQKAIAAVRRILQENPGIDIVSVSQNDNQNYCRCESCAAMDAEEGSPAGTLLRFVNAVAADIAEDYPDVVIDTLAYQYTRKAPSVTKPLPNVCIRLCSIECCFTHSLADSTCTENLSFRNDVIAWSQICDRIYVWDYTTNYSYYIPTFPNFHILRDNMRFFAEHNVKGMFPEGNYSSTSGEFGELRTYLLAKLMMDPYMTAGEYYGYMDEFLQAYYGDGWMYIRAYIDYACGEAVSAHSSIRSNPFELVPEEKYAAMEETIELWWNKAEELAGDRLAAVQRSRLQWRYIQLMLHPNEEAAKVFVADVKAAGVYWNEWRTTELPEGANLTLPPDHWDWDF